MAAPADNRREHPCTFGMSTNIASAFQADVQDQQGDLAAVWSALVRKRAAAHSLRTAKEDAMAPQTRRSSCNNLKLSADRMLDKECPDSNREVHLNPSGSAWSRPDLAAHPALDSFLVSRAQTSAIRAVLEICGKLRFETCKPGEILSDASFAIPTGPRSGKILFGTSSSFLQLVDGLWTFGFRY